jgi:hypothetical protein
VLESKLNNVEVSIHDADTPDILKLWKTRRFFQYIYVDDKILMLVTTWAFARVEIEGRQNYFVKTLKIIDIFKKQAFKTLVEAIKIDDKVDSGKEYEYLNKLIIGFNTSIL